MNDSTPVNYKKNFSRPHDAYMASDDEHGIFEVDVMHPDEAMPNFEVRTSALPPTEGSATRHTDPANEAVSFEILSDAAPSPAPELHTSNADQPEAAALDTAIFTIVRTTPLLSEDELLESLAEARHGNYVISPKTLKLALLRTNLDTDYKRYRAYITG